MKNSRGCSLSLWLWSAVTSIPFARKARLTGLTSVDARTKSQGGHRTIEIPAKPKSDRRNQGQGDERLWFRRRLGVIQLRKAPFAAAANVGFNAGTRPLQGILPKH